MKRVVIESPLSGDFARNKRYACLCMHDCLRRGEAPYASHLLMTQLLDDEVPGHRALVMKVGFAWGEVAELAVVYQDLGISGGMRVGIEHHTYQGTKIEYRQLPDDLMALLDKPGGVVRPTKGFGPPAASMFEGSPEFVSTLDVADRNPGSGG
jgi:hypothetical protein